MNFLSRLGKLAISQTPLNYDGPFHLLGLRVEIYLITTVNAGPYYIINGVRSITTLMTPKMWFPEPVIFVRPQEESPPRFCIVSYRDLPTPAKTQMQPISTIHRGKIH